MSDCLHVSYSLACSFVVVAITSVALSIWAVLGSRSRPYTERSDSRRQLTGQRREYQLQPGQWSSEESFGVERRSILSQSWICVSHRGRFTKAGDYITLEFAGFKIFLILGKDGTVRTFHNVCRHRAFPITHKASGSATLLGCRYHGWSYNTKGQLTKAPQFDQLPEFDKSKNSLFEIHTTTDKQGFVYINLDSAPKAASSSLVAPKTSGRPAKVGVSSAFLRSWELKGKFNWKSCILDRVQDGGVDALTSYGLHFTGHLYYYPLTSVYMDAESTIWFQLTFAPSSAEETLVRCDAFASNPVDAERFEKKVESKLEGYLNARIDRHERNHQPLVDNGRVPHEFQPEFASIMSSTNAHRERERSEKAEINPAAVHQCKSAAFDQAEGICKAMEGANGKLAW